MRLFPLALTLFVLATAIVVIPGCSTMNDMSPSESATSSRRRFEVKAESVGDNQVVPHLTYQGQDITPDTSPLRDVRTGEPLTNFPNSECLTTAVELFTGGANCCFGYYVLTECREGDAAAYIQPYEGSMGPADTGLRAFPVSDPAFSGYEKEIPGSDKLSLSRADSPQLVRHLVLENGIWRADKPGEFPAAYRRLEAQTVSNPSLNPTARAIALAYYNLMSGMAGPEARNEMRGLLPGQYAFAATDIFTDVENAVRDFNPVRPIPLP